MNATATIGDEEDLGYEFAASRRTTPVSERVGRIASRELTGRERASRAARYARRSTSFRKSNSLN